jgi:hypothetical protein
MNNHFMRERKHSPCTREPLSLLPHVALSLLQLVFGFEELSSLNQHRIMLARQIAIKMLNAGGCGVMCSFLPEHLNHRLVTALKRLH